jgi:hypothetical protein
VCNFRPPHLCNLHPPPTCVLLSAGFGGPPVAVIIAPTDNKRPNRILSEPAKDTAQYRDQVVGVKSST